METVDVVGGEGGEKRGGVGGGQWNETTWRGVERAT